MKIIKVVISCIVVISIAFVLYVGWNYSRVMRLCDEIASGNAIETNLANAVNLPAGITRLPVVDQLLELKIPLVEACRYRNEQAVSVLLNNGADPDFHVPGEFTALEAAILNGPAGLIDNRSYNLVMQLVQAGADVNLYSGIGQSVVHELTSQIDIRDVGSVREDILFYLLRHGAVADDRLFCYSIYGGNTDLVKKLIIECGYGINTPFDGEFYLHEAVAHPRVAGDMIETLLLLGADPTLKNNQGKNAVDLAIERGDDEIIDILNAYFAS